MRELILSNNKRLYHGAQSAADRTAATADMAETSVKGRRGWRAVAFIPRDQERAQSFQYTVCGLWRL